MVEFDLGNNERERERGGGDDQQWSLFRFKLWMWFTPWKLNARLFCDKHVRLLSWLFVMWQGGGKTFSFTWVNHFLG